MKITLFLILISPVLVFANAVNYDIGAKLESERGSTIALFHYRADAFDWKQREILTLKLAIS